MMCQNCIRSSTACGSVAHGCPAVYGVPRMVIVVAVSPGLWMINGSA